MTQTIGILCGGRSGEHEVSLQSALSIHGALDRSRYAPLLVAIDKAGRWRCGSPEALVLDPQDPARIRLAPETPEAGQVVPLSEGGRLLLLDRPAYAERARLDAVFPIIHGTDGEDGALQGLLRMLDVPFVGCDVLGSAIGMDKDVAKRLLAQAGLACAPWQTLRAPELAAPEAAGRWFDRLRERFGLPLFIKPARLGSSVGVSRVEAPQAFVRAVAEALRYDEKVLVEQAVPGREVECSVLGSFYGKEAPRASLPGEVRPVSDFYTYRAKYLDAEAAELVVPVRLGDELERRVQALAVRVFDVLECEGMARVDLFLKQDGALVVNEANTLPGFTAISMYPKLWAASGLPYPALLTRLIELAFERQRRRAALQREYERG
ncbi:MAG: D-alanine--D-alanine ligase [Candidatus Lambdaproteobacteria bacterium]|nr:D-alanine--D-alanine ligase [Candidatus Lambdaproteobacteria bacterium]